MAASVPQNEPACITRIKENAARDSINLEVLPFLEDALASISEIAQGGNKTIASFTGATRIDTHTHPVPSWFRELQPLAAGRETPDWNISSHLEFMAVHSIKRSVLCVSTPQANAFPGDKEKSVALARLLNEYVAELVRTFPERFSWMAVTALPYVEESLREVKYALDELGAVGVGVLTNHEGMYPGDKRFDPLWRYLQNKAGDKEVVFVHPTDPVIRLEGGRLVNSNPCEWMDYTNKD
jgi:predicted TIM-barrel fold metal-dependent hydrolase